MLKYLIVLYIIKEEILNMYIKFGETQKITDIQSSENALEYYDYNMI